MSLLDDPGDIIYVSGTVLDTETVIVVEDQSLAHVLSVNGQAGHVIIDTGNFITGVDLSQLYPRSNPSGFITGLDLSSYATVSNLALTGSNLQFQIDNLDLNYASQNEINTLSGNLQLTGQNLQQQIQNLNNSGFITGVDLSNYYTNNNPSGFITGLDLSSYVTTAQTGNFVTSNQTGTFYSASNPSGFITGVDLSNLYPRNNPSGFITGVDLLDYVTKTSGQFLDRPTVNGTGVLLSGEAAGSANFRYFPASGVANLLPNNRYSFDTLTGLVTGILPSNPQKGDEIELYDSAGTWHLNPLIVDNNGNYIEQKKDKLECNVRHGLIKLIYTTQNNIGWRIYPMPIHNVPLFLPPSIAITGASLSGIVPFAIALTGVNLLDPAQAPVDEWYWNLNTGDGYAISGQTIAYTYLQTGLYDVTLSGSNAAGFDVEHRFINVFLPYIPTVNVTSNKLSGLAPFTGQLGATNTTQPAQFSPVDNWYWDFDGDTIFDATGQNTTVVYNTTGTYTPTAYGVNLGGTGTGFITINVIPPLPPIPAISTSSISGFAPLTLSFTGVNLQTPAEFSPVDHWYWNVSGDSAPEFDQSVITYTFNETGNYTFYLTAVNGGGSGVASGTFSILEVPPQFSGDPYSDYVTLLLHFN